MAEVTKKKKQEKYDLEEIKKEEKKSLWVRFRIFCHGVKSEFEKVHWTLKKDMIKYSIATFVSVLFFSIFFYLIDVLFALLQQLF